MDPRQASRARLSFRAVASCTRSAFRSAPNSWARSLFMARRSGRRGRLLEYRGGSGGLTMDRKSPLGVAQVLGQPGPGSGFRREGASDAPAGGRDRSSGTCSCRLPARRAAREAAPFKTTARGASRRYAPRTRVKGGLTMRDRRVAALASDIRGTQRRGRVVPVPLWYSGSRGGAKPSIRASPVHDAARRSPPGDRRVRIGSSI